MSEELKPCPFCGGEAEIYFFERKGYLPTCLSTAITERKKKER